MPHEGEEEEEETDHDSHVELAAEAEELDDDEAMAHEALKQAEMEAANARHRMEELRAAKQAARDKRAVDMPAESEKSIQKMPRSSSPLGSRGQRSTSRLRRSPELPPPAPLQRQRWPCRWIRPMGKRWPRPWMRPASTRALRRRHGTGLIGS